MIQVFDNFLSDDELKEVHDIIDKSSWKFGHRAVPWGEHNPFWVINLSEHREYARKIVNKIEVNLDKKFKIIRFYANGQTYGQDGAFHIDDERDNTYTILLYISDITPENVDKIGGYTQFKDDRNELQCINPYIKRCVFFKSNLLHRGLAPSRASGILRISIAIKLEEI